MAITATFAADVTPLVDSVKKAEASLAKLEGQSKKVGTALVSTQSHSDRFTKSMTQFDGVLASLGVNIGSEVRALSELGQAAGKSASEIGLIGVAGLAIGAGVAGWKIGRAVSEFFDLDNAIGNATAKLLGWGDAAAEVAGAKADALARASRIIGYEVTSLTSALEINSWSQAAYQTNAEKSAAVVARWEAELAKMPADLAQLTADLDSQNFSVKDLAEKYNLTVEAIQFFARETKKAAEDDKVAADLIHDNNARKIKDLQTLIDAQAPFKAAMVELNSVGEGWAATLDTLDGSVVEAIKYYLQAGVSQAALAEAYALTASQIRSVVSALGDEKIAIDAATEAEKQRQQDQKTHDDKVIAERAAMPDPQKGKYGLQPMQSAFAGKKMGGGWTDASGHAISSMTVDAGPTVAAPSRGGGPVTITINAVGLTPAEITRQIEAELIKKATLKSLLAGGH